MLAEIAEEGRAQSPEGRQVIKEYMEPFKKNKINKIILGCTHYPIYENIIRQELEYEVELINTGETVARYIEKHLKQENLYNKEVRNKEEIYLTKPEEEFKKIAREIMKVEIKIKEKNG